MKRILPKPLGEQLRALKKVASVLGLREAAAWLDDVLSQPMCWAEADDGPRVMLLQAARERGWKVIRCSLCDRPAAALDSFHPYHDELTLCMNHYEER